MRIRSLNHSTYPHQYHIVWGTTYRRKFLQPYVKAEFLASLYATLKKYPTLYLEAVNTNEDHVHLQIEIPPNILIAAVVGRIKGASSAHLQKKCKFIREMYLEGGIGSVGYFSSTAGLNEAQVKKYIAWQGKKDTPQSPRQLRILMR